MAPWGRKRQLPIKMDAPFPSDKVAATGMSSPWSILQRPTPPNPQPSLPFNVTTAEAQQYRVNGSHRKHLHPEASPLCTTLRPKCRGGGVRGTESGWSQAKQRFKLEWHNKNSLYRQRGAETLRTLLGLFHSKLGFCEQSHMARGWGSCEAGLAGFRKSLA